MPVHSARHSCVASERLICAKHTKIQSTPEAINEVLRILRLHAQTADAEVVSDATPLHDPPVDERDLPSIREEPDEVDSLKLDQV